MVGGPVAPRFAGLLAASPLASRLARASSRKSGTACELALRRTVWQLGLRYRLNRTDLPGKPDLAFPGSLVAVFVDGDFWHGRDLATRLGRLARGHNAAYWVAKVESNVARDARRTRELADIGWTVLRFWETDVKRNPGACARQIATALAAAALRQRRER
jgi:DNA mismatch endonuclease (patch repair protein)